MSNIYLLKSNECFDKNKIGAHGNRLAFLLHNSINVRNGVILSFDVYDNFKNYQGFDEVIFESVEKIEMVTKRKFGALKKPLILSAVGDCSSGINGLLKVDGLGLNDEIVKKMGVNNVGDTYLKLIKFYAEKVKGHDSKYYRINNEQTIGLIEKFKKNYKKIEGNQFPQNVKDIFRDVIYAIFASNKSDRMYVTRKLLNIDTNERCSIVLQERILSQSLKNGVANSRVSQENKKSLIYKNCQIIALPEFADCDEKIKQKLLKILKKLEKTEKNAIKMQFFIKNNKIFVDDYKILKLNKNDFLRVLCELVKEKIIKKREAILKLDAKIVSSLLHDEFDFLKGGNKKEVGTGLAASPGAACGRICLSSNFAQKVISQGQKAILVCNDTSPEELEGIKHLSGLLAARGGITSHASVVTRGMGIPCVVGCNDLKIDYLMGEILLGGRILKEGVYISLDGSTGKVYDKELSIKSCEINNEFKEILNWADRFARLEVLANADNPKDALTALKFGAKGIGLCRTEHMFFEKDRIKYMREMILASDTKQREVSLSKILPIQKNDFISLFKIMKGYPVTIRLLDPPLHEFLPKDEKSINEFAKDLKTSSEKLKEKIESLKEFNPMMGHRGLRLAITYPEIAKMQTEAIITAAIELNKQGYNIKPEIMIPLTSGEKEFEFVKNIVKNHIKSIIFDKKIKLKYKIGSMIELPRVCMIADKIAKHAEFFSFGTNDLSQMTFGMSRDDCGKFLDEYYAKGILDSNPFKTIDEKGVGKLVQIACGLGRKTKKNLKIGVCGEQGGDPLSIEFFDKVGLDYVSCSPFRVPVARIAAAQASLKHKQMKN